MACISLTAYTAQCGESLKAGFKNKTYMVAYNDLERITGSTDVYAISNGVVNQISLDSGKKFVKVDLDNKSQSLLENVSISESGIATETATFSGSITGFTKEGSAFVKSLAGQPIVILTQLANDAWAVIGLDGTIRLTEAVGTHNATDSNRALTFSGDEFGGVKYVDSTLVATLI